MSTLTAKLLILGSGPAGYTAAIYAARAGFAPVLINGPQTGGQLTITTEIENYPGFAEPVQGTWLMEQMAKQAERVGTIVVQDTVTSVDLGKKPIVCKGESGTIYETEALIIATGAQARWLGMPDEEKFKGFGVSGCATCDGFFYRNKNVIVVGGGNSAMEEALYLANIAAHVTVIHRRDEFRGEKIMRERVLRNPKITVLWDNVVDAIVGEESPIKGVTGIVAKNVKTGEQTQIKADGVFIAIGHAPATALFKGQLDLDEDGYIVTQPESTLTSAQGVFAAGDVRDKKYRQAITAAGMGCMAALEAERYLASLEE